jgi:DNA-binding CsgD family transcriptional regulator
VKNDVSSVRHKLGFAHRTEAAVYAARRRRD